MFLTSLPAALRSAVPPSTPPVWFMRQAGRYLPEYRALRSQFPQFLDACYDISFIVESTLQPVLRFDVDAAIVFSDILVIPHALGQRVTFTEKQGPRLGALPSLDALHAICQENRWPERLQAVYQGLGMLRKQLSQKSLIGFVGAPWTIACYAVDGHSRDGFPIIQSWLTSNPEKLREYLSLWSSAIAHHAWLQIEAGADVIQIFDSWIGILPPSMAEIWALPFAKGVIQILRERAPQVPIIYFPKSVTVDRAEIARELQPDVLGVDHSVSLTEVAPGMPASVALQGNLAPDRMVEGGKALDDAIDEILNAMQGKRFIFNLGHGMLPTTPPDHVAHAMARIRKGMLS